MIEITNKSNCTGCGACENICPKQCIGMKCDKEGFWYPRVDKKKCINCDLCVNTCPVISNKTTVQIQKAYAAYSKDDTIRMQSSSGGIFTLLAEYILDNNGVVFGAAFNESLQVEHICVDNKEELAKLRTSKYVQSSIGNSFGVAREHLESGKLVLYTGTPCQIAGLKKFLKKEYNNLYTQDIVCHGVPSPMIWRRFSKYKEKTNKSRLSGVSFRSKVFGWKRFSIQYDFDNRKQEIASQQNDLFFRAFLENLILRPSCYNCRFKGTNFASDITLADFWGIETVFPNLNDDKGISLIICNNQKGQELFNQITPLITHKSVEYAEAVKGNIAATKSVYKKGSRDILFNYIRSHDISKTLKMFCSTDEHDIKKVQFLEDYKAVKKEKGTVFAFTWKAKSFIMHKN